MSAAPSVTVEPMGLCEETLSLLSRTLQPLHRNNELTGCCVSYTSACMLLCGSVSAYWVRRRLGLVLEGGGPTVWVEGVQPRGVPLWSKGRQRAPRAPLLRQFPPCSANPRSSGLTNFTAHCPYCTSAQTSASPLHSRSNTSPHGPSVVPVTPSQRVAMDFLLLMTLPVPMHAVAHL